MPKLTGFFNSRGPVAPFSRAPQALTSTSKHVVMVNGGSCCYTTLAAVLVDHMIANPHRSQTLCAVVLNLHKEFFPAYSSMGPLLRPVERLGLMLRDLPDFIPDLAKTFARIAQKEMRSSVERYRAGFVIGEEADAIAARQRQPILMTQLAAAALVQALGVPVAIQVQEPSKELHSTIQIGQGAKVGAEIVIKMNVFPLCYWAHFSAPELFHAVASQSTTAISPVGQLPLCLKKQDQSDQQLIGQIDALDHKIKQSCDYHYQRLLTLIKEQELSKADLALVKEKLGTIYVHHLGTTDTMQDCVKYVGGQYGLQDFFEGVIHHAQREKMPIQQASSDKLDMTIVRGLVQAIARMISMGQIDPEALYENLQDSKLSLAV